MRNHFDFIHWNVHGFALIVSARLKQKRILRVKGLTRLKSGQNRYRMLRGNPTIVQLSIFQQVENFCLCFLFGFVKKAARFAEPPFTEFKGADAQIAQGVEVAKGMQGSPLVIREESGVRHIENRNTVKVGSKTSPRHSGL